jgi:hypothetical protein
MKDVAIMLSLAALVLHTFVDNQAHEQVLAAIKDNGCAAQTTIKIKPPTYSLWPNWSE